MSPRLVLHVGAMKSGTSFIQSRLFANKPMLRDERGILVPGLNWLSQVMAASDVLGSGEKQWAKMAGKVRAHEGTSVISMEYLGPVRPVVAQRVLDSFPAHAVEVVITARDLNRVDRGHVAGDRAERPHLDLRGVSRRDRGVAPRAPLRPEAPESGRTFWRQQNLVRIARTWSSLGAPVSLVTVPPPGAPRELLWERFCSVLDTPPDGFAPARMGNESVGAASTLVIRRLNELLDDAGLPFPQGTDLRKGFLAKQVLAARKSAEPAIGLSVAPWVRDHAAHMASALADDGVRLVGSWDDLVPVDVPGVDPATVDADLVLDAALAGLAGVLAEQIRATS